MDKLQCSAHWTTGVGKYGIAIPREDFVSPTSNVPLSSISLQFIVDVCRSTSPFVVTFHASLVHCQIICMFQCCPMLHGATILQPKAVLAAWYASSNLFSHDIKMSSVTFWFLIWFLYYAVYMPLSVQLNQDCQQQHSREHSLHILSY